MNEKSFIGKAYSKIKDFTLDECSEMYKMALQREYFNDSKYDVSNAPTADILNAIYDRIREIELKFNKFYTKFDKFLGESKDEYVIRFRKKLRNYIMEWKKIIDVSSDLVGYQNAPGTLSDIDRAVWYEDMYLTFLDNTKRLICRFDSFGDGFELNIPFSYKAIRYKNLKKELNGIGCVHKKRI